MTLPIAEKACNRPSVYGRARAGHDLGDQRDADRELAAYAEAGQKPIEREVVDAHGDGARAR